MKSNTHAILIGTIAIAFGFANYSAEAGPRKFSFKPPSISKHYRTPTMRAAPRNYRNRSAMWTHNGVTHFGTTHGRATSLREQYWNRQMKTGGNLRGLTANLLYSITRSHRASDLGAAMDGLSDAFSGTVKHHRRHR